MNKVLKLIVLWLTAGACLGRRLQRQTRQTGDAICSNCERLKETPPQTCCRCIDESATCNNDIATNRTDLGLKCKDDIICDVFDCDTGQQGCQIKEDLTVIDFASLVDLREGGPKCLDGKKLCCNPGPGGGFEKQLKGKKGKVMVDTANICGNDKLSATQDFGHGITCGKRDARVYYDADLPETFTNPGEWPWVVLIYDNDEYIGAGALMENSIVVTVGHKVRNFVNNPERLTVRLGDWDPNIDVGNDKNTIEETPHLKVLVKCVKIHPEADLDGDLSNNVAILKLSTGDIDSDGGNVPFTLKKVAEVVSPRKGPKRPANNPKGVEGFSIVGGRSALDEVLGLDYVGFEFQTQTEVPKSYINTVCLPESEDQFQNYLGNCWVAAWGQNLERQREVDLPLVSKSDCERRLSPVFKEKGLDNWRLQPSEICAGGVPNKDTCRGEGGAPLVCYDKDYDLYFAVGLVNYGFDCYSDKPAVYTNLADPVVRQFIESSFSNSAFC